MRNVGRCRNLRWMLLTWIGRAAEVEVVVVAVTTMLLDLYDV